MQRLLSLLYSVEPTIDSQILVVALQQPLRSSLPAIARYRRPGDCKNFVVPFLHILSSLDKALIIVLRNQR